jgi:hypothetical protein
MTNLYLSENQINALPDDVSAMTAMQILQLYRAPFVTLPWSMNTWHNLTTIDMRLSSFSELPPVVWYLWRYYSLVNIQIASTAISANATMLTSMWVDEGMRCNYTDTIYSDGELVCGIDCDVTINGHKIGWGNVTLSLDDITYPSSGTMSVGVTPSGLYNNARLCEWTLEPPMGYRVAIHFTKFRTEGAPSRNILSKCYDAIYIWNGTDRTAPEVAQSGTLLGGWCGDSMSVDQSWSTPLVNGNDGNFTADAAFHFLWSPDISTAYPGIPPSLYRPTHICNDPL